jgi:dTDP-4-amino-4,6-dideoxygalactose transaminase
VKLPHLEAWTEARRRNAAEYARQLAGTPAVPPVERPGCRHVYHVYVVRLPQRDVWRQRFTDAGVQTGVHYPIPVHLQPAYSDLGYKAGDFPVSERAAGEVLSLPMFPELTAAQIGEVAGVIRAGVPAGTPA